MDIFAQILINIFNRITDKIVSINIPFLFDKTFCWSANKQGHAQTVQF